MAHVNVPLSAGELQLIRLWRRQAKSRELARWFWPEDTEHELPPVIVTPDSDKWWAVVTAKLNKLNNQSRTPTEVKELWACHTQDGKHTCQRAQQTRQPPCWLSFSQFRGSQALRWSVRGMKLFLDKLGISHHDIVERNELEKRVAAYIKLFENNTSTHQPSSSATSKPHQRKHQANVFESKREWTGYKYSYEGGPCDSERQESADMDQRRNAEYRMPNGGCFPRPRPARCFSSTTGHQSYKCSSSNQQTKRQYRRESKPQLTEQHDASWARRVLGLEAKGNTRSSIRKRYHQLAKKWHPDKIMTTAVDRRQESQATAKFQEIAKAYHILLKD